MGTRSGERRSCRGYGSGESESWKCCSMAAWLASSGLSAGTRRGSASWCR
jgi:hypothetical protein